MGQDEITRHYRGSSRTEVERAYRHDASRALAAGYLPFGHSWTNNDGGLLLAVTYRPSAAAPIDGSSTSKPPGSRTPEPAVDEFAPASHNGAHEQFAPVSPHQPDDQTPASNADEAASPPGAAGRDWVDPPMSHAAGSAGPRYVPPAELYVSPPELYASVPVDDLLGELPYDGEVDQAQFGPQPVTDSPDEAQAATSPSGERREHSVVTDGTRLIIQTMDLHCAGEPLRIIRGGFPHVPDLPVLERRRWVIDNADHIRRAVIQEPRGHRDMYGAILLPPHADHTDVTVLFMHNEGYSTMCGHGLIAITTALIEEGLFPASQPVTTIRYEVPAGIVAANAAVTRLEDGSWAVDGVRFTNVPSYLAAQSLAVRPDGVRLHGTAEQRGALSVDMAFGGAYYGIVNAAELGLRVVPEHAGALRQAGAAITDVLRREHTPVHPGDPELGFVYGTIIVDFEPRTSPDGRARDAHIRNATIFADAELDRSPCGSGTSAILAQLHGRGRIGVGQEIVNAGITGEHFLGRIEAETALGPYRAVSTSVAGTAYVTGYSTFVVDPRDPLGEGFLLT